ncbi:hypothetical protein HanPSC8_Chr06g0240451 [Helianthus annuus]|nr:hypothetical protein HanPSC8_Chr06g0240451 [Helianthus annuus]
MEITTFLSRHNLDNPRSELFATQLPSNRICTLFYISMDYGLMFPDIVVEHLQNSRAISTHILSLSNHENLQMDVLGHIY